MPNIGFLCPLDDSFNFFDHCFKTCHTSCPYPFPILHSLTTGIRGPKKGVFSVTESLKPYQQTYLMRTRDYFVRPDDLLFATWGTAWHYIIEKNRPQTDALRPREWMHEQYFETLITTPSGIVTLRGTFDIAHQPSLTLWDIKTTMYEWTLHYILEKGWEEQTDWHKQVNMYRVYGYPEAKTMKIWVALRDWKKRIGNKYDVPRQVTLTPPWIDDQEVRDFTVERLDTLNKIEKGIIQPPPCTEKELWIAKDGTPLRCEDYCPVNYLCPQFKEYQNGQTNGI